MKYINVEFFKFLLVGFINTAFTYIIYVILLFFMPYYFSYSITYIIGIFLSYYLNTKFTFKASFSFKKLLQFPAVYILQYLIGLIILHCFIDIFGANKKFAPIAVIILSTPLSFAFSRILIKKENLPFFRKQIL
jgi:putative flippase GtrA